MTVTIAPLQPAQADALRALYAAAFPEEDLVPLLSRMAAEVPDLIALVALAGGTRVGHVAVTPCAVSGSGGRVGLLGPLAVAPEHQRRGIGGALIAAAAAEARAAGLPVLMVLGDPRYYGRHGFARAEAVFAPYPLPAGHAGDWQARSLLPGPAPTGRLVPPACWMDRALWTPPDTGEG